MATDLRREPVLFAERDLTKSLFLAGLQCPKRLWLEVHRPELAAPPEPIRRAAMAEGVRVGRLARDRFPGGHLVAEIAGAERATRAAIASAAPAIYEAALRANGVRVRVDLLVRKARGRFDLLEVKSSPRVRAEHERDLALQLSVARRAGIEIEDAAILHVDRDYLYRGGALDLGALLVRRPLGDDRAVGLVAEVEASLEQMKPILREETAPTVDAGPHCERPRPCPFFAICHEERALPPAADPRARIGERARRAVKHAKAPLRFLDVEAWAPAIPRFPLTRPYQAIPFLWSIVGENGEGEDFFAEPGTDPRRPFATTLLRALGDRGTIFVDADFERRVIGDLARALPDLAAPLAAAAARIVDLRAVLERPSTSERQGAPAPRVGRRSEIRDGGDATAAYAELVEGWLTEAERSASERALRRYCRGDAEAVRRLHAVVVEAG